MATLQTVSRWRSQAEAPLTRVLSPKRKRCLGNSVIANCSTVTNREYSVRRLTRVKTGARSGTLVTAFTKFVIC